MCNNRQIKIEINIKIKIIDYQYLVVPKRLAELADFEWCVWP